MPAEAKFCSHCGTAVSVVEHLPVASQSEKKPEKAKGSPFDQVITVISWIIGFALGRFLGVAIFAFLIALLVGQWFPKWYLKRKKISMTLVSMIVWSNVLSWVLPPLGIMTGFAALELSNSFPGDRKKYKTLAVVGIGLAFVNALIGVLMNV